jgi:hypothetical protein
MIVLLILGSSLAEGLVAVLLASTVLAWGDDAQAR